MISENNINDSMDVQASPRAETDTPTSSPQAKPTNPSELADIPEKLHDFILLTRKDFLMLFNDYNKSHQSKISISVLRTHRTTDIIRICGSEKVAIRGDLAAKSHDVWGTIEKMTDIPCEFWETARLAPCASTERRDEDNLPAWLGEPGYESYTIAWLEEQESGRQEDSVVEPVQPEALRSEEKNGFDAFNSCIYSSRKDSYADRDIALNEDDKEERRMEEPTVETSERSLRHCFHQIMGRNPPSLTSTEEQRLGVVMKDVMVQAKGKAVPTEDDVSQIEDLQSFRLKLETGRYIDKVEYWWYLYSTHCREMEVDLDDDMVDVARSTRAVVEIRKGNGHRNSADFEVTDGGSSGRAEDETATI